MTAVEMVALLGLRLEDTGEVNFTSATKLKALNVAQRTVANFMDEAYLTELEVKDTVTTNGTAITNGYITLGGGSTNQTANVPLRKSIRNVQIKYGGDWLYTIMIPFAEAKKLENSYLGSSSTNPISWVWAGLLHIRPMTDMTGLVVYYLKEPTDMETSGPTNSLFNPALHEIVVDLAESQLWRMDNKNDRATTAYSSAMDQIKMLNGRYEIDAPTGVGQ